MTRIYMILIFTLIFLNNVPTLNASPLKANPEYNVSKSDEISPLNFLKDLKSTIDQSKLSIFSYRPNQNEYKTHLYFVFIFFFFILIIIRLSSPDYFSDLFLSLFKKNYLFSRIQKSKFNISINSIFLDIIFIAVLSFFLFQYLYTRFELEYYLVLGGLLLFTFIQMLIILISYYLFFGTGNVNVHLTNLIISNRIIGIIFAPLLFIITYLNQAYQPIGLNILLGIFVLIIFIRIYRIINQLKIIYNFNFLFIILYICTFELSVYFVCFKIVLLSMNS
jgi:hypothetical protein